MDQTPGFEELAAGLRADAADERTFLEVLAGKLTAALPDGVRVEREGGLWRKQRPVVRIEVPLGDWVFRLERQRNGALHASRSHTVHGVALSTESLPLDAWIQALSRVLSELARQSEATAQALRRFLVD